MLDYLVTFGLLAKLPSSSAEFSDTKDKDKIVKVKDGTVEVNNANFTVKWIGAWKEGAKQIVAVEDWYGGKVRLDDETAFENPVSKFYVVPALLPKSQGLSVWASSESDIKLRVRFMLRPRSEEKLTAASDGVCEFLPDSLFNHLLARMVCRQPKEPKLYSDRLIVETRAFRYMVEYHRAENQLLLTVSGISVMAY